MLFAFGSKSLQQFKFHKDDERCDIDIVLTKMTGFCRGVANETYERYLFNTRSQGENESVDEFYSALLALSKNCSFGKLTSSLMKDRVIVGIQDNSTRQRLLSERELSLQKCMEIARSYEGMKIRMKTCKIDDLHARESW